MDQQARLLTLVLVATDERPCARVFIDGTARGGVRERSDEGGRSFQSGRVRRLRPAVAARADTSHI